jgi:hypothetical protein
MFAVCSVSSMMPFTGDRIDVVEVTSVVSALPKASIVKVRTGQVAQGSRPRQVVVILVGLVARVHTAWDFGGNRST